MNLENIRSRIAADKDALIATIREIVAVPSVGGEAPTPDAPFGPGPKAALDKFVEIGKRMGFRTWAFENQVGIAEEGDESTPEMVAVLAHVDVVPAGDGWSCDPWQGKIEDGLVYGRGVADDKGPAISALYALKAMREEGVRLKRRVRVIVGTNEELGSKAIARYVQAGEELPVAGFTPDSGFPLVHGEKGIINVICHVPFASHGAGARIVSIDAGVAANAVPDHAEAVLEVPAAAKARLERIIAEHAAPRDSKLTCTDEGSGRVRLVCEGLAYHGARPQWGSNAAANLVRVMRLLDVGGEQGASLDKLDTLIGTQTRGENLGMLLYDDPSGFSSLCWGILKTEGDKLKFTINYRFPVTYQMDSVRHKLISTLNINGIETSSVRGGDPLYMPLDSDLVQKLMKVYRDETGDTASQPKCIGGGTYAKQMPNMLAFGNQFPGENCHIHEADERWSIDHIVAHTNIMAAAIAALAVVEE